MLNCERGKGITFAVPAAQGVDVRRGTFSFPIYPRPQTRRRKYIRRRWMPDHPPSTHRGFVRAFPLFFFSVGRGLPKCTAGMKSFQSNAGRIGTNGHCRKPPIFKANIF